MKTQALIKALALASVATGAGGFAPSFLDAATKQRHPPSRPQRLPPLRSFVMPSFTTNDDASSICTDISESAPRDIASMELWAGEYGIQRSSGFQLTLEDATTDREVYAATNEAVAGGTPVLFVPEALILSSNKAMAELRSAEMAEAEKFVIGNNLDAHAAHKTLQDVLFEESEEEGEDEDAESELRHWYLMLKVLVELENGRSSPWHPWLDSLPRYYSNAVAMTNFCLTCLPPLMRKLASEERENQRRLSVESLEMVPFLSDETKQNQDLCKWAYQIVYTRAFEVTPDDADYDGDLKIVPLADYFNHGSAMDVGAGPEITPHYDADGNYYALATYDLAAGAPLRVRYADPRNPSHLLARYGFLDEDCPATYCKLLPPTVNPDMIELGYSYDKMLFYRNGEVADEVWDIVLYQHLGTSADLYYDQQLLMTSHRTGDYTTKAALHENHYGATSQALLQHVDGFIAEIDKLIQKTEGTPSVYVQNEHPRLPLIHKHNLFVRETFQNVRNRYSSGDENWREATRVTVEECDGMECAIAECVMDFTGNWNCEGGLGPNWDGSERTNVQRTIAAQQ